MKFFTFVALFAGASALKLHSHSAMPVHHVAHQAQVQLKGGDDIWAQVEEWVGEELANGGTITKKEAHDALSALAAKHGVTIPDEVWDQLEEIFDAIDTNDDGELDAKEVAAAVKHYEGMKGVKYPTEEEVKAWVESELAKDGSITWDELEKAIFAWAESQGVTIPAEVWEHIYAGF